MNAYTPDSDEELEELAVVADLLGTNDGEIEDALDRLFRLHSSRVMSYLQTCHPGVSVEDHQEILIKALERLPRIFRADPARADRPILPLLLRTALEVGREKYRQVMGLKKRDDKVRAYNIGESLQQTDIGQSWKELEDRSFRDRVSREIRAVAAAVPPRQKQLAMVFAETWELKLTEIEFIDAFFKMYGERLIRNQVKRGLQEVREKLSEPMDRILKEEGYARRS